MSHDWNDLAGRLNACTRAGGAADRHQLPRRPGRRHRPVRRADAGAAPDGRTGRVPAGCVFWMHGPSPRSDRRRGPRQLQRRQPDPRLQTLDEVAGNSDVAALLDTGWVTMDIVPQIPVVTEKPGAVVYGPLAQRRSIPTSCCCGSTPSSSW